MSQCLHYLLMTLERVNYLTELATTKGKQPTKPNGPETHKTEKMITMKMWGGSKTSAIIITASIKAFIGMRLKGHWLKTA